MKEVMDFFKIFFIEYYTYFTYQKIIDTKTKFRPIILIEMFFIAFLVLDIRLNVNYYCSFLVLIFLLNIIGCLNNKKDFTYSMLVILIAFCISYIIQFISIAISFFINEIYFIKSDYINFLIIIILEAILLIFTWKIKRIQKGFNYLKERASNDFLNITVLNIGVITSCLYIILLSINKKLIIAKNIFLNFLLFIIIFVVIIKKSIEAYYKQKLLIQDLNETKKELDEKKKEIEELEAEILNFSKKSHSLAHKQKSLEFKINKLLMNSENTKELGLEDDLKNLSKELYENSKLPELEKTGITEIDDMLSVMQEECRKNGIDFSLQLKGNIYQMTNNFVTKEEISILLADHIKDAIIAINHSDNINKSIMVRLGKINEYFGIYIYDSGVEFPKEVLENLGKKPITTYSNEGGTGMGFMNTFDTLKKHNASLIIESIGKPTKDNYTKVIKIVFDNKYRNIFK